MAPMSLLVFKGLSRPAMVNALRAKRLAVSGSKAVLSGRWELFLKSRQDQQESDETQEADGANEQTQGTRRKLQGDGKAGKAWNQQNVDDQEVERGQEGIVDEQEDDQASQYQVTAAFANLWLQRKARVSRLTRELLKSLKYPRKFRAKEEDDISEDLEPVRTFVQDNLKPALRDIVLHSNPAVSLEQLRLAILEKTSAVTVPVAVHKAYEPLFKNWGIKMYIAELTRTGAEEDNDIAMAVQASMVTARAERRQVNDLEMARVALVQEELVCIQNAIDYRISLWIKDTPTPAIEDAEWPEDFSTRKRKDLRSFVRRYLDENQEYWAENLSSEQQEAAIEGMMSFEVEGFPLPKDRSQTVLRAIFNEVRTTQFQQDKRSCSRSASQAQSKSEPESRRGSLGDINNETTTDGERASLGRGTKRVRIVKPQQLMDEDEDEDSMPVRKVRRSNGGRGGRMSQVMLSVEEEDE